MGSKELIKAVEGLVDNMGEINRSSALDETSNTVACELSSKASDV